MRVLMLGWEFPPFITGGLGTACHGLTKALDRRGIEVLFALPKAVAANETSHVQLLSPERLLVPPGSQQRSNITAPAPESAERPEAPTPEEGAASTGDTFEHVEFIRLPIVVGGAYGSSNISLEEARMLLSTSVEGGLSAGTSTPATAMQIREHIVHDVLPESRHLDAPTPGEFPSAADYGGDLMAQAHFYAHFCAIAAARERFDVIHAHDWLTFPAGLAVSRLTGRPLVVHVHSTEFDRSGEHVNQRIYDIERRGMHGAMKIIAVSQLTKNTIVARYGIAPEKVEAVYNGVDLDPTQQDHVGIDTADRIVLYFGRITHQKGPEYFIRAARRVLDVMQDVKFVVAGSGDMARHMIEMAANLGIGHKVLFTGFLRGRDIDRVFAMADVYVMPSVSEPFGIAPLEAMGHNVPVIISKSSGVSEVLTHALKVDFWDVDDTANKIVAVLRHPPLQRTLQEHGRFEVRRLTWDGAAERCERIYRALTEADRPPVKSSLP